MPKTQDNVPVQRNDFWFVLLLKMERGKKDRGKKSLEDLTRFGLAQSFPHYVEFSWRLRPFCRCGLIHRVVSIHETGSLCFPLDKTGIFPDLIHVFHGPA